MPSGVYSRKPFTEDHKQNISKSLRGRSFSIETRKKMSEAQKAIPHINHKIQTTCANCGKSFLIFQSRKKQRNYCSTDCVNRDKTKLPLFTCEVCGKKFKRSPSLIKRENARCFCSKECSIEGRKNKIYRTCPICGKTFETTPSLIKRGGGKTCSRNCFFKYYSKEYSGENHHQWKGGASFTPYCEKFNFEFKERVREFWGRHCCECGISENETGRRHSVHHVNFNKNSCCDETKPLFVILCHSCHSKTNHNRMYWQDRFTRLIDDHNSGCSYFDKNGRPA